MSLKEYHKKAIPELQSAERLAKSLEPWRYSVPKGPVLETGAGTGHFTKYLLKIFPERAITIDDNSERMIAHHREKFGDRQNINWVVRDIEEDLPEEQSLAMICGNHTVHKFRNPAIALENLAKSLRIDGLMLMAFPGEDSFKEWRSSCLDLGIPYTGRPLPETEPLVIHLSMGPVQVDFYEDQSKVYFNSFSDFLNHCRNGGFAVEKDERQLTPEEIELLNEHWKETREGEIGITYHNVFLALKRIGE